MSIEKPGKALMKRKPEHPSSSVEIVKSLTPTQRLEQSITKLLTREKENMKTMTYPASDNSGKTETATVAFVTVDQTDDNRNFQAFIMTKSHPQTGKQIQLSWVDKEQNQIGYLRSYLDLQGTNNTLTDLVTDATPAEIADWEQKGGVKQSTNMHPLLATHIPDAQLEKVAEKLATARTNGFLTKRAEDALEREAETMLGHTINP
jgi:hypothetical protein